MRRRLLVLLALLALGSLVAALPASAASHDVRAKKKTCVLKKKAKCKKANLSKQKIGKQNLAGAKLAGANLSGATLTGTNLAGADLTGANLRGATLNGVNLTGAKLAGATFTAARLSGVDFSAPSATRRSTRGPFAIFRCAISLSSLKPAGIVAECKGAWLNGASFVDATIADSDFRGAELLGAKFTRAKVTRTDFSGADLERAGLQDSAISNSKFVVAMLAAASAQGATISGSDFTDALVESFEPMEALTKAGSSNVLTRTLGLNGRAQLLFDSARGTKASASVDAHSNNMDWNLPSVSCRLLCFYDGLIGDTFTATISTLPGSTLTASRGITCAGSGFYTCTGTLNSQFMSIYVTPPPPTSSVTVNSVLQNNAPTPMSKIRFESVAANGARTIVKTCVLEASCTATVVTGTSVRISVFREHSNGYFGMNCPGETGDAFTNNRTLWPTGDDTLSGDAGDTTRYALHRICDAFTVTGDVTLTAINDTPDGAPSG